MKPSDKKLGVEIQLFLIRHGMQVDDLAQQMGITADALSNLIHGRRGFKNSTLEKLAHTTAFQESRITLSQLRAWRALDEYSFEELILAIIEAVKQGEIERLPQDFFQRFQASLEQGAFPSALADKKRALLSLIQEDPS